MAQTTTLEGLRSQLLTTIFGRRFGLDPNDYVAGFKGSREPVNTASSASSTSFDFGGTLNVGTATGGTTWNIAAPVPGVKMTIVQGSTAGGVVTIASGAIIRNDGDTASSTLATMTFAGLGQSVTLQGLTTALAAVVNAAPMALSSASSTQIVPAVAFS